MIECNAFQSVFDIQFIHLFADFLVQFSSVWFGCCWALFRKKPTMKPERKKTFFISFSSVRLLLFFFFDQSMISISFLGRVVSKLIIILFWFYNWLESKKKQRKNRKNWIKWNKFFKEKKKWMFCRRVCNRMNEKKIDSSMFFFFHLSSPSDKWMDGWMDR